MSKTVKTAGWEEYDYPLVAGAELVHTLVEDIRKRLWLWSYGKQATAENVAIPTGTWGVDNTGWWGTNGSFREGNAFPDEDEGGLSSVDNKGPGEYSIWFHEGWGNNIGDAGASDYDIKGATIDHTTSSGHEIWIENVDLSVNESVNGNMLVDCPLEITGVGVPAAEINGYWRIK